MARGTARDLVNFASVGGNSGSTDGVAARSVTSAVPGSPTYAATNGTSAGRSAHTATAARNASSIVLVSITAEATPLSSCSRRSLSTRSVVSNDGQMIPKVVPSSPTRGL